MARVVGVLGGTFDPPHLGHLFLAVEGLVQLQLEKVLWVLTPLPPHKSDLSVTPLEYRIEMLNVIIDNDPEFLFSKADIDRDPPHYALGTMEFLHAKNPSDEFIYLMGGDSLRDLPSWHQPLAFLAYCRSLGVLQRRYAEIDFDHLEDVLPGISSKVAYFEGPSIDISGHDIRERVRTGIRYKHLLPPGVSDVIQRHNLYR